MKEISLETHSRVEMIDITAAVQKAVREEKMQKAFVLLLRLTQPLRLPLMKTPIRMCPAILLPPWIELSPFSANYRHAEGNSAAHVKSSLVGASEMVIIETGRLVLGTWQSIFFCEFDGPRTRKVFISIIAG